MTTDDHFPPGGYAGGVVARHRRRERLGRLVRDVWIGWAREQPAPKPSWLVPWEELSEPDREVDRRIGEELARAGRDERSPELAIMRDEIASLRVALAAEREAHAATERSRDTWIQANDTASRLLSGERISHEGTRVERDAAIARAETAERERDAFRAQAEASLVVPCACGRPVPSVSSRLRCDACRAEGERDEARAQVVAMRAALLAVWDASARGDAEKCPQDNNLDLTLAICATKTVTDAPDAGAPLLAELRALRAVRDAAEPAAVCHDRMRCFGLSGFPRDGYVCPGCRLRAALDAAKGGG